MILEIKDIPVLVNYKLFTMQALLCDDGLARVSCKSLPYSRQIPMIISTPYVKIISEESFKEYKSKVFI